jgi:uncharacterized integral membrane protein
MFILGIFIAIGGVLFALQNNIPVTVTFLLWRFESSLAVVLLLAVAVGAIVVALLATPTTLRRQWAGAKQKKRIQELEKESEALKARVATLEASSPAKAAAPSAPEAPRVGLD